MRVVALRDLAVTEVDGRHGGGGWEQRCVIGVCVRGVIQLLE